MIFSTKQLWIVNDVCLYSADSTEVDTWINECTVLALLSGVPDYFDRNKILSGYDLSHYQVPHCIKSFLLFCLICVYSSQFSILF